MVAMLAFGGTYAYFTDVQTIDAQKFSTGKVDITAGTLAAFNITTLMPGDSATAAGSVTVDATDNAYIGLVYTEDLKGATGDGLVVELDDAWEAVTVGSGDSAKTVYVYVGEGEAPAAVTGTKNFTITATLDWEKADNAYQSVEDLTITVEARAIQAKNFVEANVTGGATLQNVADYLVNHAEALA